MTDGLLHAVLKLLDNSMVYVLLRHKNIHTFNRNLWTYNIEFLVISTYSVAVELPMILGRNAVQRSMGMTW